MLSKCVYKGLRYSKHLFQIGTKATPEIVHQQTV